MAVPRPLGRGGELEKIFIILINLAILIDSGNVSCLSYGWQALCNYCRDKKNLSQKGGVPGAGKVVALLQP